MTWRSGEPWDMKYSRISGNITTYICHSANRLCVCVNVCECVCACIIKARSIITYILPERKPQRIYFRVSLP